MIPRKTKDQIDIMRNAGKILAEIIAELEQTVCPGVKTSQVNDFAEELIRKRNVKPAFKGYNGYPATLCTSINDEIVHGIPGNRILKDGDIISLDLGLEYEGYFVDSALTLPVGRINERINKLIKVTKQALELGITQAQEDNHLFDISHCIQDYVERNGFSVVRQFVGHGIGKQLHEEPPIPNYGLPHQGPLLKSGMVLAIEPMVNMGTCDSYITDNGWTAVTRDGLNSAHFEHTVAITDQGPEVLTR